MSEISIRRAHALAPRQAREAADKMAKKLEQAFDMRFEWDGEVLGFERSGLDGELTLHPGEVQIEVRLGFLLTIMGPKIEQSIKDNLDNAFSAAKSPGVKPPGAKPGAAKKKPAAKKK